MTRSPLTGYAMSKAQSVHCENSIMLYDPACGAAQVDTKQIADPEEKKPEGFDDIP